MAIIINKVRMDTKQILAKIANATTLLNTNKYFWLNSPYFTLLFLLALMGFAFYMRTVPVYALVFTTWPGIDGNYVNFTPDDAVYHMRLVHNTLTHYPWRIFFDPFTHFPYGNQVHFGPIFTLIIATAALIIGVGHPSYHLVDVVGAFTPAVMGACAIIPAYFIGKNLFGRTAGLFSAAFLTFLPGEFFDRSLLGFTDHHIAEVLFSALTLLFLLSALKLERTLAAKKSILLFAILAGCALGLYLLIWASALLLVLPLCLFFSFQILINHYHQESTNALMIIATLLFGIATVMVLPYAFTYPTIQLPQAHDLSQIYYSLLQPIILLLALCGLWCCYAISCLLRKYSLNFWLLPLIIIVLACISGVVIAWLNPRLLNIVSAGAQHLFHTNAHLQTITEMLNSIIDPNTGAFSLHYLWNSFYWALPSAIIGFGLLSWRIYKYHHAEELMFFFWSLLIATITIVHRRYSYYFAMVAAVLAGYVFWLLFSWLYGFIYKRGCSWANSAWFRRFRIHHILTSCCLVIGWHLITYPWASSGLFAWVKLNPQKATNHASIMPKVWYDSLVWLREHTPVPEANYADGFYKVPANPQEKYSYSDTAYGVMSWWDYGHDITFVAERIPNANPYQIGILENNDTQGAAPFFVTTDEAGAIANLNAQGTRYIIIDLEMATIKFRAISIWANVDPNIWINNLVTTIHNDKGQDIELHAIIDREIFHNCMLSRLYYKDGDNMSQFRLIYESAGDYVVNAKTFDITKQKGEFFATHHSPDPISAAKIFLSARNPTWVNPEQTLLAFDSRPPVKAIKIFEFVKGAKIIGHAPSGTKVTLNIRLHTKEGRELKFSQEQFAILNSFQFTVPYSTDPIQSYDIYPSGKYELQIDDRKAEIEVPEKAVLNGDVIAIKN